MSDAHDAVDRLHEAVCRLVPTDGTGCGLPGTLRNGLPLTPGVHLQLAGAGPALVRPCRAISGYGTTPDGMPVFAYHHEGRIRLAIVLTHPTAPTSLRLPLRVDHPGWLDRTGRRLTHTDSAGATPVELTEPLAVDADGAWVPAGMQVTHSGIHIITAHSGRRHPVVVYNIGITGLVADLTAAGGCDGGLG